MVQALSAISERKEASTLVQDEVNFEVETETGSLTDYIVGPANPASPYEYLLSGMNSDDLSLDANLHGV